MGRPKPANGGATADMETSGDDIHFDSSPAVGIPIPAQLPPSDSDAPLSPNSEKPDSPPPVVVGGKLVLLSQVVDHANDDHLNHQGHQQIGCELVLVPDQVASQSNGDHLNQQEHPQIGRRWKSGLFDCGDNQTNAMMTAYFPCVTFGQIAEILDEGQTSCPLASLMYLLMSPALCSCWILGANYRQRLRQKYYLVQAPSEDWIVHLFCPCCALCQEFRELQSRGIDPSLGWMGYLAQQQETNTVPPNGQVMNR